MLQKNTGDQTEARKFTRRQFVGRAAALGLSVSALPALSGLLDPVVAAASSLSPSRRRHTSCLSDWSSDVCSSDLERGSRTGHPRASRRRSGWFVPVAQ